MAEHYTPNDEDMRWHYAVKRMDDGATRTHAEQEYTRWLAAHDARVKREALDGLAEEVRAEWDREHRWVASAVGAFRDNHCPETEDQT